jgi:hypothetical protein
MRLHLSWSGRALAAVLLLIACTLWHVPAVSAQDCHGCPPDNLIPNCNFDTFTGAPPRQVPEGWVPFVLSNDLTFKQAEDTLYGAPSLMMWSNGGTFVAGIWTQVGGLQPGATYKASVGWAAPNEPDSFGRRLGIDPTGGTDPNSPGVIWAPMHRGPGRRLNCAPPDPNIDVSAVARSSTITVFFETDHNYSTGDNYIFVDTISLVQDSSQPVAPPTAVPPTAAPQPAAQPAAPKAPQPTRARPTAAPTATFTPAPTATATVTAMPTNTATPTQTATATITPTPTQTYTPEPTPSSTLPPRPTATAGAQVEVAAATQDPPPALLLGGAGALGIAGLLGIAAVVVVRKR